ncbi:hypothetical protein MPH_09882 [Macrophomina phaseolina MS6]|uniref:Uncharacterized protein n=1 Tax=Macrophomina phaseolina (strain MS6) TaxID=1126212 RepID=K2RRW2_MACPH|nr:hypothetical protein MPH_09882 [Macrophomina phaseolina MS6]
MPGTTNDTHPPPQSQSVGMSSEPLLLCLVSHARSPPLHPKPALKFDLRSVPNPSRALRKSMTGKHATLRKELEKDPLFQAELGRARTTIKEAMAGFEADQQSAATGHSHPQAPGEDGERRANVFLVGCFCEAGKHRSPAFVESLAATGEWPQNCHIRIAHRELDEIADLQALIATSHSHREVRKQRQRKSARFPAQEDEIDELGA